MFLIARTVVRCATLLMLGLSTGNNVVQAAESNAPEEVIVIGGKSRRVLEQQIVAAEDHMYELFNTLNMDHRYDIHCHSSAPLGTLLRKRQCSPVFYDLAFEESAEVSLSAMVGSNMSGGDSTAVYGILKSHYPILKQKLKEAIMQYPDFSDAVQKLNALREELEH